MRGKGAGEVNRDRGVSGGQNDGKKDITEKREKGTV